MEIIEKLKKFEENGAVTIKLEENFYTQEEWQGIESIILDKDLPTETVYYGDVGEPNKVDVARFVTDVEEPKIVNKAFSEPLIKLIYNERVETFLKKFLKISDLFLRRCQLNILEGRGFIGKHLDIDSNPDYLVAVILHFDEGYLGGDFYYYPNEKRKKIDTFKNCVIISSCSIAHEVTSLESGKRKTLVFFLSEKNGKNKSKLLIK